MQIHWLDIRLRDGDATYSDNLLNLLDTRHSIHHHRDQTRPDHKMPR